MSSSCQQQQRVGSWLPFFAHQKKKQKKEATNSNKGKIKINSKRTLRTRTTCEQRAHEQDNNRGWLMKGGGEEEKLKRR